MESIGARGVTVPGVALPFPGETTVVRDLDTVPAYSLRGVVVPSEADSLQAALPPDGASLLRGVLGPVCIGLRVKLERVARDGANLTVVREPRAAVPRK
jgi:hypothetical protein